MPFPVDRPKMKQNDHPSHAMPEEDYDGTVLNPDMADPGFFSKNTERFTRDKNERRPYSNDKET